METIRIINRLAALLFMLCYGYQLIYTIVGVLSAKDAEELRKAQSAFREVNPEDWG